MNLFNYLILFCFLCAGFPLVLQGQNSALDSTKQTLKSGWSLGGVPAIAYESDLGFRYGVVLNLFHFGKPSVYPAYKHNIYFEVSRTTKGNGINNVFYDSKYLLPRMIRVTADFNFLTEKALDFYGFNGYEADFNSDFEDDESSAYISRVYYRHQSKSSRIHIILSKVIGSSKFSWLAGFGTYNYKIASVDIDNLNRNKDDEDKLPDVPGLYDEYVEKGIIPQEVKNGGNTPFLRAGIVYDTRDKETNPNRGVWAEVILLTAPSLLGNKKEYSYTLLNVTHRQYFSLIKKHLILAGRIAYQGKIGGNIPWYMLPNIWSSYQTTYGFGGGKSVRGARRNRITGDAVAYSNAELRWNMVQGVIKNQNFGVTLCAFWDAARVTERFNFQQTLGESVRTDTERLHNSIGLGLHFVYNDNFVVTCDYGRVFNKADGYQGLYINLDFLF